MKTKEVKDMTRKAQKEIDEKLINHSATQLMLDFLHDVLAVSATAGNEIDLNENDFKKLAKVYAKLIDKKYKRSDN